MDELYVGQGASIPVSAQPVEPTPDLKEVVTTLARERLKKYFQRMGPTNFKGALELYCWNHELGAAFNVTLQQFEICLRNNISRALADKFGENWFRNLKFTQCNPDIRIAVERATQKATENRNGFDPDANDFVAATSLGLWRELCKPGYAGLFWSKRLHLAFPYAPKGRDLRKTLIHIHSKVHRLTRLRNRIVHHEPIIGSHLEAIGSMVKAHHNDMRNIIEWMSPNFLQWLEPRDKLAQLIEACPYRPGSAD
jgi:hypothetical protein